LGSITSYIKRVSMGYCTVYPEFRRHYVGVM